MTEQNFNSEQLFITAQENAVSFALIAIANAKEHGIPVDSLIERASQHLLSAWRSSQQGNARSFIENITLNIKALGGDLDAIEGDSNRAEASFKDWVRPAQAQAFGLTLEEADQWWHVFAPLASAAGLHYSWQHQDNQVKVTVQH